MKALTKLPLYLGLFVFLLSVLVSSVKLSEKRTVSSRIQATGKGVSLSMQFTKPDLITIFVNSAVDIEGIDVAIGYDEDVISIYPSTLQASDQFFTTGGNLDSDNGQFIFSAIAKSQVSNGLVGQFHIGKKQNMTAVTTKLEFLDKGQSAVFEKGTGNNILENLTPIDIDIP